MLSQKLSDLNAYGWRIDHREVDPLGDRNRRWLKQPDCPTVTRWVEKDMKNKFATSRTTRESMRRVLILASRLSDSDNSSGSLAPRGARLNRSFQQALQRISSESLN
jgi:hypothetical protein